MNNDVKIKIIELLKSRGAYSTSVNNIQHYTRCPYCGDSRNLSHAHMSVKIDIDSDAPMMYRCLKCDSHGLLTDTTLSDLDLPVTRDLLTELKSYTRKSMKAGRLVNLDFEKNTVPLYQDNTLNMKKLNYLNDRLDMNMSLSDAKDNKIILNLFDFMKHNELQAINGLSYGMMNILNENYIGFLSCNNNCITFRDITGKMKYRYFKVTINQKNINQDSFYALPSSISLMYTNSINVHFSEGVFDILSIKENVVKSTDNNYFYAMCGFGGIGIIRYLIHHGMNTGINLHIYSDNDKTDKNHEKYLFNKSFITEWIDHIYIHRNGFKGEKDYGVPSSRISDTYRKIK